MESNPPKIQPLSKKNLETYAVSYIGAYLNTVQKERPGHLPVLARIQPCEIEISILPNNCFVMLFDKGETQILKVSERDWGTLWRMMLNSQMALTNYLLSFVSIRGPDWLGNADWAVVAVIIVDVWIATPFVFLVISAGLTGIPYELHESASLDGATRWQSFMRIDIPLLAPLLLLTLMFRMLESLLSLDSIYTLTLGGPGYAPFTMTYYIYTLGLLSFNLGLAAAASWLFMAFASFALAFVFWLQRRWQTAQ